METERERERERERESVKRRPASIEQDADWSNVTSSGRPAANENCERSVASNPTRLFSDSLFVCFFLRFFFVPSSNGIGMGSDWSGKRDTQKKKTNNNKKKHPVSELGGCGRGKIDFFFFTQTKKKKKRNVCGTRKSIGGRAGCGGGGDNETESETGEREREREKETMDGRARLLFVCLRLLFMCSDSEEETPPARSRGWRAQKKTRDGTKKRKKTSSSSSSSSVRECREGES